MSAGASGQNVHLRYILNTSTRNTLHCLAQSFPRQSIVRAYTEYPLPAVCPPRRILAAHRRTLTIRARGFENTRVFAIFEYPRKIRVFGLLELFGRKRIFGGPALEANIKIKSGFLKFCQKGRVFPLSIWKTVFSVST